jgi:uncharacterized membrane protein (UPF0127 family)
MAIFDLRRAAAATVLLALAGTAAAQSAPRTVQMTAGIYVITAEVANDEATRERGLMFREGLPPNHGMLFLFDAHDKHCMWMRNTLIPLAVAFIDDDGTIANIEEMKARTDDTHCAAHPVRYALEMSSGWFSSRGIKAGMKLGKMNANGD